MSFGSSNKRGVLSRSFILLPLIIFLLLLFFFFLLSAQERMELMRQRKRFVNELEEAVNSISKEALLRISKMSSEEAAAWLQVGYDRPRLT